MTVKNQVQKIVSSTELNKSQKMIALYQLELGIKEIAVLMDTRYNFVYNVVSNHCIKNGLTISTNKGDTENKKDVIIKMFQEGKSNKEIAIELKTNYNYVFNVVKKYKESIGENVVNE